MVALQGTRGEEQLADGTGLKKRGSSPPELHPAGYTPPTGLHTKGTGKPPLSHVETIILTLQLLSE